ncbi:MAG: ABC transporter permease [Candidatus Sedimenticola endophacoides]|uniref:Transport permease protein n=1 Tax=Candidatus Sedimenticola endophacoides TaxID=2548426 RepID=A0A6N4DZ12_9GAMM|nr:MAG: ABC transporter permease [Candidatus Sedimenticola endophacoides]OQX37699.1 MAG: ABC transporter permease [Candidatus Sedimenticola endophacoides]OQX41757.1 MAG: ABC transporter permease [Candidatus Sedimenticola endophacoides]OQX42586.1 MAG: ABC transporter permease [Candidatus Sedimenticola endophacoides]PUE02100.1 MAG: ABC transporter permease [Candidatus Sedimenticola endophacoides]
MNRLGRYAIAFNTIITKEFLRFIRIWVQTVLPPVITTALYYVIFGTLIGERIGEMDGFRYIDFIVPGLILMAVITNAYSNVVSSFFSSKYQRHVEELLISPVPNWVILAGYVAGGVARGVVVGVAVTAVSLFFTDLDVRHYGLTLAVVVLTAALFSLAGFINAVYANSFDDISIVPTFVLTPLTYLGGVFYSIHMLPPFWQAVSLANPVLYMVNAFRYGLLGVSDISIFAALAIILGFIAGLTLFALGLLRRGVGVKS